MHVLQAYGVFSGGKLVRIDKRVTSSINRLGFARVSFRYEIRVFSTIASY